MQISPTDSGVDSPPLSFSCPKCLTTIHRQHGTFQCPNCGYAPGHGAD
jgi:predicted RNA-binding Zn-ribbon protein involved in translation (DUF1610 family)